MAAIFTPFSFSSKKLQNDTTGLLTAGSSALLGSGGVAGALTSGVTDIINEMLSWYEMWVNPEKVDLSYSYVQTPKQTAGAIVTFHYRRAAITMSVSGQSGWILNPTANTNGQDQAAMDWAKKKLNVPEPSLSTKDKKRASAANRQEDLYSTQPWRGKGIGAARTKNASDNSARKFIQRIRTLAEEPMYYVDLLGVEHYNTKYIKIYTKQYPSGVICEGYFTSFNIPEGKDDYQSIQYNFTFMVENMKPISLASRILGKFANSGKGSAVRSFTGGL